MLFRSRFVLRTRISALRNRLFSALWSSSLMVNAFLRRNLPKFYRINSICTMKQTSEKWFTNMNNIQHGRPRREIPQNAGLSGGAHRRQNPARMRACSARGPASNGVKNVLTLSCCRGVIVSQTKAEKRSASCKCGPAWTHKNGFRGSLGNCREIAGLR